MRHHVVNNTMLNLYRDKLQKIRKVECLEAALTKDDITYCESVVDVDSSTNISSLDPSACWDDTSHSQTCMDITEPTSSWIKWEDY